MIIKVITDDIVLASFVSTNIPKWANFIQIGHGITLDVGDTIHSYIIKEVNIDLAFGNEPTIYVIV